MKQEQNGDSTVQKKKKIPKILKLLFAAVILIGIGALIGELTVVVLGKSPIKKSSGDADSIKQIIVAFSFVAMLVVFSMVHIILHEAGHLIMGLLTHYRFCSFRVGSLMLVKKEGKLQWKKFSLAGTGGQCLLSPPDWKESGVPFVWYNLGGVLMNLLIGIICGILFFALEAGQITEMILSSNAIVGIMYGLLNGIPMKLSDVHNDGQNILSLRKSKEDLYSWWLLMKVNEALTDEIRLKDMPDEWFYLPKEDAWKSVMQVDAAVFYCNRLMDKQNIDEVYEIMDRVLKADTAMQGIYKQLMRMDLVFCEIMRENRKEITDLFLDKDVLQIRKAMKNFPSVLRNEYCYSLLVENDSKKAETFLARFEKVAASYPNLCEITTERELMNLVDRKKSEKNA